MKQRLLLGAVAAMAIVTGIGVWWAGRSQPSRMGSLSRGEVLAALPAHSAVEPPRLELPTEPKLPAPAPAEAPPEVPRVEVAKTAPQWVQEILRSSAEQWKESQHSLTHQQRSELKQKIYDYFNAEAAPELERRRLNEEWELIPPGPDGVRKYSGTKEDERVIYSIVMPKEGVYRIVLPREQFPDLYALKERADALLSW